ncbi:MAG: hypothetical protein K2J71_05370 [Oscillospiraceae bacterium]|nr:hypothetical protein [Oscillospiraceae bacterium]
MRTYIYPENLRSSTKLWFWSVKDFCILCGGIIIAAIFLAKLWTFIPVATVICYAFLTFRADDTAVIDYMMSAIRYFCFSQQEFHWGDDGI